MNRPNPIGGLSERIASSVTFKVITMVILVLLLLIPASMIKSLIREREYRQQEVIGEIGSKWGNEQTIVGPIISIPYKKYHSDDHNSLDYTIQHARYLPDTLHIESRISSEKRYRGMYEAVLYNTKLELSGSFTLPDPALLNISPENIIWENATVIVGISDLRGIKKPIYARFGEDSLTLNSGLGINGITEEGSGINAPIRLSQAKTEYNFKFDIDLNGSYQLNLVPVGRLTDVTVESDWPDPGFTGEFLPAERVITPGGFTASWTILDLNRNFPQHWHNSQYSDNKSSLGIKLVTPVDVYQKSMRTVKYALMFIMFAFLAFFFSEIMNKLRVHPIQYLLIGLAIVLFYSLLISISEHTNFDIAYWISSLAIIGLITGYSKSILKKTGMALTVGCVIFILYGYLYIILQLEDYALMMGSVGLFVVLGLVMFLTRKIDWYNIRFENNSSNKHPMGDN